MAVMDNIKDELKRIPWWGYVAGVIVLFLAWHYIKNQNAANTAAAQANAAPSGQTGLQGTTGVLDTSGGGSVGGSSLPNSITVSQPSPATIPGPDTTAPTPTPDNLPSSTPVAQPAPAPAPPAAAPAAPAPAPAPAPRAPNYPIYTVRSGDTLSAIGSRYGIPWQNIYNLNNSLINSTAQAHGFASSDSGHWIFPGEQLKIPA